MFIYLIYCNLLFRQGLGHTNKQQQYRNSKKKNWPRDEHSCFEIAELQRAVFVYSFRRVLCSFCSDFFWHKRGLPQSSSEFTLNCPGSFLLYEPALTCTAIALYFWDHVNRSQSSQADGNQHSLVFTLQTKPVLTSGSVDTFTLFVYTL